MNVRRGHRGRYFAVSVLALLAISSACGGTVEERPELGHGTAKLVTDDAVAMSITFAKGGIATTGKPTTWKGTLSHPLPAKAAALAAPVKTTTPTSELLAYARSLPPDTPIVVAVVLREPGFDWASLRGLTGADRTTAVNSRKTQVATVQAPTLEKLTGLGATGIESHWVNNAISCTLPAKSMPTVAAWAEVASAQRTDAVLRPTAAGSYTGDQVRTYLKIDPFISAGFDGSSGARLGGRVRVGIMETDFDGGNRLAWTHKSFTNMDGTPRIKSNWRCDDYDCIPAAPWGLPPGGTHATVVTALAAGNIEDGEDPLACSPATCSTLEKKQRSWLSPRSDLYVYGITGCLGIVHGLARGIQEGIDVVNMSFGYSRIDDPAAECSITYDCGGVNAAILNARTSGIVVVTSSGNWQIDPPPTPPVGSCTLIWPAGNSQTVPIGALDTENGAIAYDSSTQASYSSWGGEMQGTIDSRAAPQTNIFGLPPGMMKLAADQAPSHYSDDFGGTSAAAPIATGIFADMRSAWNGIGWPSNVEILTATFLSFGDGYDYANPGVIMKAGLSRASGAGRIHAHWPSYASLTAPAGWGQRSVTLTTGGDAWWWVGWSASGPLTGIKQWKMGAIWYETEPTAIADIDFYVWDKCHGCPYPGHGNCSDVLVASQTDMDQHNRFRLLEGDIGGKCLLVQAHGYAIPTGGRTFYAADWYSADID